jgi:hypothetical protein
MAKTKETIIRNVWGEQPVSKPVRTLPPEIEEQSIPESGSIAKEAGEPDARAEDEISGRKLISDQTGTKGKQVQGVNTPRYDKREKQSTDDSQRVQYRCIPTALKKSIDDFAWSIQTPIGVAARLLLEYGLQEYQAGHIQLTVGFCPWGRTLFPNLPGLKDNSKPFIRRKHPTNKNTTFRGIPQDLKRNIFEIAQKIDVPEGEVARIFFEHSLNYQKRKKISSQEWVSLVLGSKNK